MSRLLPLLALSALLATSAHGQQPAELAPPLDSPIRAEPWPPLQLPPPATTGPDAAPLPGLEYLPRLAATTLLKFGSNGLGVTDIDGGLRVRIPLGGDQSPLEIKPGAAAYIFDGPAAFFHSTSVYDLFVDFAWRPRLFEWLFIDMEVTPDLATDFRNLSHQSFRPRGRALAIVAFSEQFQLVGGLVYANRLNAKLIPAGGFLYTPSADAEYHIVFPAPRASWRIFNSSQTKYHLFVEGEFGGGSWAVRRADGADDVLGYSDLRAVAGLEAEGPGGRRWWLETGYVFGRRLQLASGIPDKLQPTPTLLLRAGLEF